MKIKLELPDGSKKEYDKGITGHDVAKSIGERLARDSLAITIDGEIKDLNAAIEKSGKIKILTLKDKEGLDCLRHSLAHLLAAAVMDIWPDTNRTIGPAIENGFYYDFEFKHPITEDDLPKLEKKMRELLPKWDRFVRHELSETEAKKEYHGNKFKHELIDEFSQGGKKVSFYKSGDYWDLCRGGHVSSMKSVKPDSFKLTRITGAYWRGNEKNPQLTRIYGLAFASKKELEDYEKLQEEIEKRDHRKLGKELDIFEIVEEVGPGLVFWLPKGTIIKDELENWAKETEEAHGYKRVSTPVITKEGVFHTSEHLPHYKESMFSPMDIDGEKYYIKPMNCPFHHMIFKARSRSYRELPLRLAEYGLCHRYEQSGAITGLLRVRGMQMNDAHIYCTREQAVDEFISVIRLHEYYYKTLGITDYSMELALRNPDNKKYHGHEEMWKEAEELMMKAMKKSGVKYTVVNDGAAFYGPKIDFQIKSVIGRSFTASTNQIDLFMGNKFKLEYVEEDGKKYTPVIIHRAPLGTHERFVGFLLEHFAGKFPLWLSPVQVKIMTVSDKFNGHAYKLKEKFAAAKIRVEVDDRSESIPRKVRDSQLEKVPLMLTIGEKEIDNDSVAVRTLDGQVKFGIKSGELLEKIKENIMKKELKFVF